MVTPPDRPSPADNPIPAALVLATPAPAPALAFDLLAAVVAGRCERTARAYRSDYEDFGRFLKVPASEALAMLVAGGAGMANAMALGYKADLMGRKLAASTIARRLTALRVACRIARMLGCITWSLEVESPRAESYRDTAGPGREGWRSMLGRATAAATTPRGRRDLAILRLLHDLALRRGEVVGLDLADCDLARGVVHVLGKGKTAKVPLTLPAPTRAALADWIAARGDWPGPLFCRAGNCKLQDSAPRLTGESVRLTVRALGRAAALSRPVKPHGLRHQGITRALDVSGGDVRAVRRFSRHAKLDTITVYDDNREDLGGRIAEAVADE